MASPHVITIHMGKAPRMSGDVELMLLDMQRADPRLNIKMWIDPEATMIAALRRLRGQIRDAMEGDARRAVYR